MSDLRNLIQMVEEAAQPVAPRIDPKTYNLKAKYGDFNRRYFGGQLPEIPLEFRKMKNVGGKVSAQAITENPRLPRWMQKKTLVPGSMRLALDTTFLRTEREIDAIMLHEMVHVWVMVVQGDLLDEHGPKFMAKLNEISAKVGYKLPVTEAIQNAELAQPAVKPIGVLLLHNKDGGYSFALIRQKVAVDGAEALKEAWLYRMKYVGVQAVALFEIASPEWTALAATYTINYQVKKITYWRLQSPTAVADLHQNGRLLFRLPE